MGVSATGLKRQRMWLTTFVYLYTKKAQLRMIAHFSPMISLKIFGVIGECDAFLKPLPSARRKLSVGSPAVASLGLYRL